LAVALLIGWMAMGTQAMAAVPQTEQRPQVLILLSYHPGHSWEDRILQGFAEWGHTQDKANRPVFYTEWLDTKRYPDVAHREHMVQYLEQKYAGQRFDLVATMDDNALSFVVQRPKLFGETPVVYSGINGDVEQILGQRGHATGILERFDLTRTLHVALALHRDTKLLLFISAQDETGAGQRDAVNAIAALLPKGLEVEHQSIAHLGEVTPRLSQLPEGTLIFTLGAIPQQAGGIPLEPEDVAAFVHQKSVHPVYTDLDSAVGRGAVGGYMNSGLETGRLQARMAQRVLSGEDIAHIPMVRETPLAVVFDYAELKRFELGTHRLPYGSVLVNAPASVFDPKYRIPLIGFSALVTLLIAALAVLIARSRMQAERTRALHHQATHDALTGLPNRSGLAEMLKTRPSDMLDGEAKAALVMLGLNRFKLINDTYGHAFGDDVLAAVTARLRNWCSHQETLVRFSGDSFVIISHYRSDIALQYLRSRCETLFQQPFLVGGRRLPLSAAFGLSTAPHEHLDPEQLVREADAAMHEAKRNRSTQVVVFDSGIHERATRQFQIEASLPDAIARGEIEVYFQPIMDTALNRIAGFEALARWKHPQLGDVPPLEFVRAATESGQINALTQCVLRKACLAFVPHVESSTQPYLAVNVTVSDLYGCEFPEQLAQTLASIGMPAHRLVLEVTEDMLLCDEERVAEVLGQLHALGVRIAIDDFGTGYSSMGYLSSYRVQIIKVDRSFVRHITSSSQSRKIVRAIVSMASDLELTVVTEGVETAEQSALLHSLGCVLQQGYVYSRPLPASQWPITP
jgi:diguanylate cyclase (GGDEF)-like protein